MTLNDLNSSEEEVAKSVLFNCCSSKRWLKNLLKQRPFSSEQQLFDAADNSWKNLDETDYLEAFDGHPRIGDLASLREKYAASKNIAGGEQSSVNHADEITLTELSSKNDEYFRKFGFIFIVFATGKSASEMLDRLIARLSNDRAEEVQNAAEEQRKIFQLRLRKLLSEEK